MVTTRWQGTVRRVARAATWRLAMIVAATLAPAPIAAATAADEISPLTHADQTARPTLYNAVQELLWPWRETHFNCITSTTLLRVGADPTIQKQLQLGRSDQFEGKLSAIIEQAYQRCRRYLDGAVARIDEWNEAVAAHPITGDYRKLLLESYISGAFLGVKSALVYFAEAPEDYEVRTVPQLHGDMSATLSNPDRQVSVTAEIGPYAGIVQRSHERFMALAPPE